MFKIREIRFVTSVALILAAGFTVSAGLRTASFAVTEIFSDPATAEANLAFAEQLGVGSYARRNFLALQPQPPADPFLAQETIKEILARSPLSPGDWFFLASYQQFFREEPQNILASLALSAMTGPNEGFVMARRSQLASQMLDLLPPDLRRVLVSDLLGAWSLMDEPAKLNVRSAVAKASIQSRQELRAALLLNNKAGAAITTDLDLSDLPKPVPAQQ